MSLRLQRLLVIRHRQFPRNPTSSIPSAIAKVVNSILLRLQPRQLQPLLRPYHDVNLSHLQYYSMTMLYRTRLMVSVTTTILFAGLRKQGRTKRKGQHI